MAHGTFGLAFPFGDVCSSRSSATKDRALAVSGFLAGGITRVGAAEKAELARLGLRVIDASAQGWGIINHDLFLSNANVRQVIRRAIDGRPIFRA